MNTAFLRHGKKPAMMRIFRAALKEQEEQPISYASNMKFLGIQPERVKKEAMMP